MQTNVMRNEHEPRISVRVPPDLKRRLNAICAPGTGLSEPELIRACVKALCDYYDEYQSLPRDIAIRPSAAEIDSMRRQAADNAAWDTGKKNKIG
jgi:hypothetical protein